MPNALHSLHDLNKHIQALLPAALVGQARYVVGYSGGLDSTVLLHWLAQNNPDNHRILAVHIHHGLQDAADSWASHCAAFCAAQAVEFEVCEVQVNGIADLGLEAAARQARYAAFQSVMQADDVLLLAQHRQDQAETVLLQLMRGGAVAGLAAMPAVSRLGQGYLLRPLLDTPRETLLIYAEQHGLEWIDDPSNQDDSLDRNYLRNQLMPGLRERWLAVDSILARTAGHMAEASALLDEMAAEDLVRCKLAEHSLSVSTVQSMTSARRRNLLRFWLQKQGQLAPSTAQMQRIEQDMLTERGDAEPRIKLTDMELRRYRDWLTLLPELPAAPTDQVLEWQMTGASSQRLDLPAGCGYLLSESCANGAIGLPQGDYRVSFMRGGERIKPLGSTHHRSLKQLFQEAAVPPWVRRRMPLIYHGQQLVAVADRWLSSELQLTGSGATFGLQWRDSPPGWQVAESVG